MPAEPLPLQVVIFSYFDAPAIGDETVRACEAADLVIALGGVNLDPLAQVLQPSKPALAVLGPADERNVPRPFRPLHANGFSFRGWRIAGFSGAPRGSRVVPGNYLSEAEADTLLGSLPACDILLSHAPPATLLREAGTRPDQGFGALDEYIRDKPPIYHFFANPGGDSFDDLGQSLSVGVCGFMKCPPLQFV